MGLIIRYLSLLLLFICISARPSHAQETDKSTSKSSGSRIGALGEFYEALKVVDKALLRNQHLKAQQAAYRAEACLSHIQGDPDLWAKLALVFARVNIPAKAKIYQAKAAAKTRGSSNRLKLTTLATLAASYTILNDQTGLKMMFEKAIADAPKHEKPQYKIAYVNGLFGVDANLKASSVLTELYTDIPLTSEERAEILSLLIINSLKLNQIQQVDHYYHELIALQVKPTSYMKLALGMYLTRKTKINQAKINFRQLLQSFNSGKRDYVDVEGVIQLANLYSLNFKKDSAEFYFSKIAAILPKPIEKTALGNSFLKVFRAHQLRFNHKNAVKLNQSRDSVYQKELMAITKELTYKYKIEQDKQRAALMQKQRAVEALTYEKRKQRFLLIISGLSLLMISSCAVIYILYQRRKQSNQLHLAEVERLKQIHKTEVIKKLSASQEAERWRIADQLHDEVGSMISVVRLNLSEHPLKKEPISPEKLATANRVLADVADTVREMSHQLMPVAIRQYGLINAIEQLINDINTSGKIYIEHLIYGFDNLSKYPEDFQVSFYRIVQELFQNIVKHAKATNAIFQLIEHPDSINLYIEDNGRGIANENKDRNGKGIGLLTNRIDYFEGKISIEGQPGKGTLIVIDIPTSHMFGLSVNTAQN